MRAADHAVVNKRVAKSFRQPIDQWCVARHVDQQRRRVIWQVLKPVIGDDAVIETRPLDERRVRRRGQAHHLDTAAIM